MCGIVGVNLSKVTKSDLETVKRLFLETEIRGKHASGISWYDGSGLNMESDSKPISEFMKEFSLEDCLYDGNLTLIGHIRYSTSDIKYNQPIGSLGRSFIVHNGVVTQSEPEVWKDNYGYDCETRNDSELLYHCLENQCDIEAKFPRASYALLKLSNDGEISHYRNGLRPMWVAELDNGILYSSTKNILLRAGVQPERISKVQATNDKQKRDMDE